jgi:hypothetical protein
MLGASEERIQQTRNDADKPFSSQPGGPMVLWPIFCPAAAGPASHVRIQNHLNKEVVGIHVLLTRLLFGDSIPRRLLLRVSPVKSTSAPVRC